MGKPFLPKRRKYLRHAGITGVVFSVIFTASASTGGGWFGGWLRNIFPFLNRSPQPVITAPPPSSQQSLVVKSIKILKENAARVDWSPSGNNLIAFDYKGADGFYDIAVMRPDGSNVVCLTCNNPRLPNRNIGQPAWHPSGKYIVFQAEKANHRNSLVTNIVTDPGRGVYNDLWLMTSDGKEAYQLTDGSSQDGSGVLHPHFSSDGTKLAWSEIYMPAKISVAAQIVGLWRLKVADFSIVNGVPRLTNTKSYQPGDEVFYENHGFSPDGKKLIFSSNFSIKNPVATATNIYTLDLATGAIQKLTSAGYNEHAEYSPDGKKIVWMTDLGHKGKGTDLWVMNADGSNKQQLTFRNTPGNVQYSTTRVILADHSFSPDGRQMVQYQNKAALLGLDTSDQKILLLTFQ